MATDDTQKALDALLANMAKGLQEAKHAVITLQSGEDDEGFANVYALRNMLAAMSMHINNGLMNLDPDYEGSRYSYLLEVCDQLRAKVEKARADAGVTTAGSNDPEARRFIHTLIDALNRGGLPAPDSDSDPLELFEVVATPGASINVGPHRIQLLLALHRMHAWGDLLDDEDRAKNQRTVESKEPGMIMSVWLIDPELADTSTNRVWIITDQIAQVTTVLLPSEY